MARLSCPSCKHLNDDLRIVASCACLKSEKAIRREVYEGMCEVVIKHAAYTEDLLERLKAFAP